MRRCIIAFTLIILVLSLVASLAGVLSCQSNRYRWVTTPRGDTVEVQDLGIYRYSVRALVASGIPWDFVRLTAWIPLLSASFLMFLRGSVRGTTVFIGALATMLYQYLLWTFDWAYNQMFLIYVAVFSLSLWTLVLVLRTLDWTQFRAALSAPRYPRVGMAMFCLAVGAALLFKVLGEVVPGLPSGTMPQAMAGYYTMVDQALDLGLLSPFSVAAGILLLKREALGYLLSGVVLILLLSVGLSVVAGELMLGLSTGHVNGGGIAIFAVALAAACALLALALASVGRTPRRPGPISLSSERSGSAGSRVPIQEGEEMKAEKPKPMPVLQARKASAEVIPQPTNGCNRTGPRRGRR